MKEKWLLRDHVETRAQLLTRELCYIDAIDVDVTRGRIEKTEHGEVQHAAWETIQRSHAIANGIFVAVPNRVGHERPVGGPGIEFWGQSFVVDPAGRVVARASADREEVLVVPCDLAAVETARTHWPFLRDRRVDAYGDLTRRLVD